MGFFKTLKKRRKSITYIIERDPLGEATRDGEFSLFPYYSVFEAVLGIGPGDILKVTQRIIVAKFNLLSRCELG